MKLLTIRDVRSVDFMTELGWVYVETKWEGVGNIFRLTHDEYERLLNKELYV